MLAETSVPHDIGEKGKSYTKALKESGGEKQKDESLQAKLKQGVQLIFLFFFIFFFSNCFLLSFFFLTILLIL
jgi:hypothetical protein